MSNSSLKKEHFISLVQREFGIQLLRAVGQGGEVSIVTDYELRTMARIHDAAERIPENMTALDAARLFVTRELEQ